MAILDVKTKQLTQNTAPESYAPDVRRGRSLHARMDLLLDQFFESFGLPPVRGPICADNDAGNASKAPVDPPEEEIRPRTEIPQR